MARKIAPAFKTFRIDLSAARVEGNAERIEYAGNYWCVVNASSDSALAQVSLDANNDARLPAPLHRAYRSTASFERLWVFNEALGSGEWIDLVVAQDPAFEIIVQAGFSAMSKGVSVSQAADNIISPQRTYDGD